MAKSKRQASTDNNVKMLYYLENNSLPVGRRFTEKAQIQSFVDYITGSGFWTMQKEIHPLLPPSILVFSFGDSEYSEAREPNEIWLACKHWNAQVVLHELAHFFSPEDHHGPKFVRAYIALISHFMGLEYAAEYSRAFRVGGIKF